MSAYIRHEDVRKVEEISQRMEVAQLKRHIRALEQQLADRAAKWGPPPTPGRWMVRSKFSDGPWWSWQEERVTDEHITVWRKYKCVFQHAPCPDEPEEHGLPEGCE